MILTPLKITMLIILVALEVPAAIFLAVWWKRAYKNIDNQDPEKEEDKIE